MHGSAQRPPPAPQAPPRAPPRLGPARAASQPQARRAGPRRRSPRGCFGPSSSSRSASCIRTAVKVAGGKQLRRCRPLPAGDTLGTRHPQRLLASRGKVAAAPRSGTRPPPPSPGQEGERGGGVLRGTAPTLPGGTGEQGLLGLRPLTPGAGAPARARVTLGSSRGSAYRAPAGRVKRLRFAGKSCPPAHHPPRHLPPAGLTVRAP